MVDEGVNAEAAQELKLGRLGLIVETLGLSRNDLRGEL
jgi:hypothetical protein